MIDWNEVIARVKGALKEANADSRLTNKHVVSIILSKSQVLLQRESDKLKLIRIQDIFQSLNCIEMQEVSTIDDCCGVDSVCTLMRSKYKIPEMYNDDYGIIIKRITTIDESIEIKLTTPSNILRIKKDKKSSKYDNAIYAFFRNDYLFITNKKYPIIKLEAFFKEDLAFNKVFKCGKNNNCTRFLSTKWIIPQKLQDAVISLVIQDLASLYKKIPEDINITKTPNA